MTTIYLIRHAEAEGNHYRRIQGQFDGFLTPRGRRQIDRLAERFRDIPVDALWSSDLYRTRITASAVQRWHDLPLQTTPRLREMALGIWEDRLWGDAQRENPEQMYCFSHAPERWSLEGGEPFEALTERMYDAVTDIAAQYPGKTVVIVSHGMALRALQARVLGLSVAEMGQVGHGDNTCVSRMFYENGQLRSDFYNDTSHLDGTDLSTFSRQRWHKVGASADLSNLSARVLRLPEDEAFYLQSYESSWRAAHGSTEGFEPSLYLSALRRRLAAHPDCARIFFRGDEPVGLLELDPDRCADEGAGWIVLCCITEQWRGCGYGVQLLGEAISYYRRLGRKTLRLHVAVTNDNAIGFYRHSNFTALSRVPGVGSELWLMQRPIFPSDF